MEVSEDIQDISLSTTNGKSLASFGFYFFHRMSQCLTFYIYSETFNSVNETNPNEEEHSIEECNFKKCDIPYGKWEVMAMFFLTASCGCKKKKL